MARRSILVIVVSVFAFVGVGVWAQPGRDPTALTTVPEVIFGENVGIRVTGPSDRAGSVQGTLVVKVNGRWVDVVSPTRVTPAGK